MTRPCEFRTFVSAALGVLACMTMSASAQTTKPFDHTFRVYHDLLTQFVRDGKVDYVGLSAGRPMLDRTVEAFGRVTQADEAMTETD